jgi:hypothetical protein
MTFRHKNIQKLSMVSENITTISNDCLFAAYDVELRIINDLQSLIGSLDEIRNRDKK